jgi:hypothetical protein
MNTESPKNIDFYDYRRVGLQGFIQAGKNQSFGYSLRMIFASQLMSHLP